MNARKMIKFQQSQVLTSHFESFWSIVKGKVFVKYQTLISDFHLNFPTKLIQNNKVQSIPNLKGWIFDTFKLSFWWEKSIVVELFKEKH